MPEHYTEILDDAGLKALMAHFSQERPPLVAMDFEGEFNLHCYGEKLCLIQIYDGKNFYLIDPFPITAQLLGEFLTMKNMVWLFFSGDSDASLVYKQYGVRMRSIYDVQHLVEVLDLPKKGLGCRAVESARSGDSGKETLPTPQLDQAPYRGGGEAVCPGRCGPPF